MTKCFKCKSKVGILDFECKCKQIFCKKCRYSENHKCSYDYKTEARKILEKENQLLVPIKLEKI